MKEKDQGLIAHTHHEVGSDPRPSEGLCYSELILKIGAPMLKSGRCDGAGTGERGHSLHESTPVICPTKL
jgi:hypothetical protein